MDDYPNYNDYRSTQPEANSWPRRSGADPTKPLLTPRTVRPAASTSYSNGNEGVGALVCGILGLFMCGVVLGPIAIYLGSQSESGMARAGKVLGIIALIGWALYLVYVLASNAGS